jgi:hypothetical protein
VESANGLAPVVGHRRQTHKQLNLGRGARPGVRNCLKITFTITLLIQIFGAIV